MRYVVFDTKYNAYNGGKDSIIGLRYWPNTLDAAERLTQRQAEKLVQTLNKSANSTTRYIVKEQPQ